MFRSKHTLHCDRCEREMERVESVPETTSAIPAIRIERDGETIGQFMVLCVSCTGRTNDLVAQILKEPLPERARVKRARKEAP